MDPITVVHNSDEYDFDFDFDFDLTICLQGELVGVPYHDRNIVLRCVH
jgi:hypothetical protein